VIWMTLRQHRIELFIFAGVTIAVGIFLLVTGLDMHNSFQQSGAAACLTNHDAYSNCDEIINSWETNYEVLQGNINWLSVQPALFGVLFGVPLLAREYEQRTQLLAWTQSITRRQWLLIKIGLLVGATLLFAGVLDLVFVWWNGPFDQAYGRFAEQSFDFAGITPFGYALFALALGLAAGALLRRTIPAVAVVLAGYIPLRLMILFGARPHYMPPLIARIASLSGGIGRLDWRLSEYWTDTSGHPVPFSSLFACESSSASKITVMQCFQSHGWVDTIVYQPISRYWPFQLIETGIFAGLAIVLLGFTIWWVGYRPNH
jgi:hypothetical protein